MKTYRAYQSAFLLGGAAIGFTLLLLYLGVFLMSEISDINAKKSAIVIENETLNSRLTVLQTVTRTPPQNAEIVLNALPTENNSLLVVNQVRIIAEEKSVTLKNLDLNTEASVDGVAPSGVLLSFDVEGEPQSVIDFIAALRKSMPIMTLDSVNTQTTALGNLATSIVNLKTRWAPLPDRLPAITEAISGLTQEQQDLLSELSQYRAPQLILAEGSVSAEVAGRENPFTPAQ